MDNKHEKKFIINTLVGLVFTTGGIFSILYVCFNRALHTQDWVFWAVIAAIAINTGLLFIGSGAVHKVKADLIRRQKSKNRGDKLSLD